MKQIILGTAGHIDHGKTALIKALTGVDLDRLKEERERGITIELGFASLPLSSNQRIGVVDVPGHERFIKRMVAGAGGVDVVLLVVAADDGVMPQTREHLDICRLLGIENGLIAVTKADLVDSEWLGLIIDDVSKLVQGTFLEKAPIIPVSALSGEGIPELVREIEKIVLKIQGKSPDGLAFLPIDRVFTMKGFGTVVTGTLISGQIKVGETVEILPPGIQAKVRGIQVYNASVEAAFSGQRTAINVQGLEKGVLDRGDVLSHPGLLQPSRQLDVSLELLPNIPRPLKHGESITLHLFSAQTVARIITYGTGVLEPGGDYDVQLRLSEPLVAIPGARFVIRNLDATCTLGGGMVLDPHPPRHRRGDVATPTWFQTLRSGDKEAILTIMAKTSGRRALSKAEILRRIDASWKEISPIWKSLCEKKVLLEIGSDPQQFVHSDTLDEYRSKLQEILKLYHHQNPLKPGMPLEEARGRLGREIPEKFYEYLTQNMKENGEIEIAGMAIFQASHKVFLQPDQTKLKSELEACLRLQGLTPPTLRELADQFHRSPEEIKVLLELAKKEETLVKVKEDLFFFRNHLLKLKENLIDTLRTRGEITPGEFKDLTGVSRKYSIPLLEYFDQEKVTIRVGDKRVLRDRKAPANPIS